MFLGFPCGSAGKESTWNVGDLGSIPGLGRSSGEGKVYPLQYSGLENPIDCIVHRVAKSDTTKQLSLSHPSSNQTISGPHEIHFQYNESCQKHKEKLCSVANVGLLPVRHKH